MTGFWGERPEVRFPKGSFGYDGSKTRSVVAGSGSIRNLQLDPAELEQQEEALKYWREFDAQVATERRGQPTSKSKVFPSVKFKF